MDTAKTVTKRLAFVETSFVKINSYLLLLHFVEIHKDSVFPLNFYKKKFSIALLLKTTCYRLYRLGQLLKVTKSVKYFKHLTLKQACYIYSWNVLLSAPYTKNKKQTFTALTHNGDISIRLLNLIKLDILQPRDDPCCSHRLQSAQFCTFYRY